MTKMTENEITKIIDGMTIEQKVGQMLMGSICGGESLEIAKQRLNDFCFGGMQFSGVFEIFIRGGGYRQCGVCRNFPLADVAKFLHDIKAAALDILPVPIIMAGDQEGGISSSILRRRNISLMPRPMGLGANGSPEDTYLAASVTAREVKAVGLDMLYGPCLDVITNPGNSEIGARSFGEDPEQVAVMAEQVVRAYAKHNVISNIKHFPGRGQGKIDAHWDLETLDQNRSRLDAVELLPFRRAIAAGADSIMLAHTHFSAFDPDRQIPASLSPNVIKGFIRGELGFEGMIIPDDMSMFAITKHYDLPQACAMCVEAGADMILMKVDTAFRPTLDAITESVQSGRLSEEQLNASMRRIIALKAKRGLFELGEFSADAVNETVGSKKNATAATKLARKSILVLRNDGHVLPVRPKTSILAIAQRNEDVIMSNDPVLSHQMLPNSLAGRFKSVDHVIVDEKPTEIQIFEAVARAKNADLIVFGLYGGRKLAAETIEMLEKLIVLRPVVVLISESPYVIEALPAGVKGVICGFGITPSMFEAAADLIAGKLKQTAKLPVTINKQMPRGFAVEMG